MRDTRPSPEEKSDERSVRTRSKLLDAAERLFAERGFKGTSMREITALADVNIAAANYHFGGKEGLFREVLRRYAEVQATRRQLMLDRLERTDNVTIETLLTLFVQPAFDYLEENPESGVYISRLLARIPHEVPEVAFPIFRDYFHPSLSKVENRMKEQLPDLTDDEFHWFLHCLRGIFFQSLSSFSFSSKWQQFYVFVVPSENGVKQIVQASLSILDGIRKGKDTQKS